MQGVQRPKVVIVSFDAELVVHHMALPGQEVTVRVINNGSGRPERHAPVWLYVGNPRSIGHIPRLEQRTDSDGTVVFHLQPPLPGELFGGSEGGFVRSCSHGLFRTEQVLREGVVADNVCDRKGRWKGKFIARPGEIIVFIRKQYFQD